MDAGPLWASIALVSAYPPRPEHDPRDGAYVALRLRDGDRIHVREALPADEPAIAVFLAGLCLEARWLRFFSGGIDLEGMAHTAAATGPDRIGLIALDESGAIVGHALSIKLALERAEVAVEVADALHGEGLGTILIERLAELAERRGIATFVAEVLPENHAMLDVFRDGFDARVGWSEGVDKVEFPTAAWRLARTRFADMFDTRPICDEQIGDGLAGDGASGDRLAGAIGCNLEKGVTSCDE